MAGASTAYSEKGFDADAGRSIGVKSCCITCSSSNSCSSFALEFLPAHREMKLRSIISVAQHAGGSFGGPGFGLILGGGWSRQTLT